MEEYSKELTKDETEKNNTKRKKRNKYTLEDLVKGINEENRHEEIITDRQGKELI